METFLAQYIPLAALLLVGIFFAVLLPILSLTLGPNRKKGDVQVKRKQVAYESGMAAIGEANQRLPVKFYRLAVLFILFDVDIILLVPYVLVLRKLGLFGLWSFLIFIVVFILGDLWVWKKGFLEWE